MQAVIFDLDDTLYDFTGLQEAALDTLYIFGSKLLEVDKEKFKRAFLWGRDETKRILGHKPACRSRALYCQHALEYLHKNPITYTLTLEKIYWNYILEHMVLRDGVKELLDYLKKNEIKVAVCTDMIVEIQYQKIKRLGISEYIDVFVSSEEAGVEKPEVKIFEICLKKLKVLPSQTIMVGDSLEKDVIGALSVKILPIWFCTNEKKLPKEYEEKSVKSVTTMSELKQVLIGGKNFC